MGYSFYRTDDPVADAERYYDALDEEYAGWLAMRPKCKVCEEPIEEDYAVEWEGGYICECAECRKQLAEWLLDDYVDNNRGYVKEEK